MTAAVPGVTGAASQRAPREPAEPARLVAALLVQEAAQDELVRVRAERAGAEQAARIAAAEAVQAARAARRARIPELWRTLLTDVLFVLCPGIVLSFPATIWGAASLQPLTDEHAPYMRGLRFLLRIAFLTGGTALGATQAFDVLAWRRGANSAFTFTARRLQSAQESTHTRTLAIVAVVTPIVFFFLAHATTHGPTNGPPTWFWWITPVVLALTHIGFLTLRAAEADRLILFAGAAAGLLAGIILTTIAGQLMMILAIVLLGVGLIGLWALFES